MARLDYFSQYHSNISRRGLGFDKPEKDNATRKEPYPALSASPQTIGHTGYTGTFVLINIPRQRAGIFLSNRTYYKDERAQWIKDRDALIEIMKKELVCEMVDQGK